MGQRSGSNEGNRNYTLKNNMPYYAPNNYEQTLKFALASDVTTTSASFVTLFTTPSFTTSGGNLIITAEICNSNSAAAGYSNRFQILLDGATITNDPGSPAGGHDGGSLASGNIPTMTSITSLATSVAGGSHTITIQWSRTGGTARCNASTGTNGESCRIKVQEVWT